MVLRVFLPLAAALLLSNAASAQQALAPLPPFASERLQLDPDALASLATGSGETLPGGTIRAALALELERNPLVLLRSGFPAQEIIHNRFVSHFAFAWGVHDRIEVGAELPFVLYEHGDTASVAGFQDPSSSTVLAPSLNGRLTIVDRAHDGAPVDVALNANLTLPLGGKGSFGAGSDPVFTPQLLVSAPVGPFLAAVNLGATLRKEEDLGDDREGSELTGAASLAIGDRLRGEVIFRNGFSLVDHDYAYEVYGAVRVRPIESIEIYAMGGPAFGDTPGQPDWRAMLGVAWTPSFGSKPAPAPAPAPEKVAIATIAAPPPPPPAPVIVEKPKDPCDPGEKHTPAQCPALDDDGDGLANSIDACPLEPGPLETRGCPVKDTDGDGVPDHLDNCPTIPGPASNQGCPVAQKQLVIIKRDKLEITDKVYFASGKALLLARSYPLLDQIAQVMKSHPDLPAVFIDGHTDSSGNAAQNKQLSAARAETVRKYLVKKGVPNDRLTARGFGSERPIDTNKTTDGRANNRRVEFNLAPREGETSTDSAPKNEVKP